MKRETSEELRRLAARMRHQAGQHDAFIMERAGEEGAPHLTYAVSRRDRKLREAERLEAQAAELEQQRSSGKGVRSQAATRTSPKPFPPPAPLPRAIAWGDVLSYAEGQGLGRYAQALQNAGCSLLEAFRILWDQIPDEPAAARIVAAARRAGTAPVLEVSLPSQPQARSVCSTVNRIVARARKHGFGTPVDDGDRGLPSSGVHRVGAFDDAEPAPAAGKLGPASRRRLPGVSNVDAIVQVARAHGIGAQG